MKPVTEDHNLKACYGSPITSEPPQQSVFCKNSCETDESPGTMAIPQGVDRGIGKPGLSASLQVFIASTDLPEAMGTFALFTTQNPGGVNGGQSCIEQTFCR